MAINGTRGDMAYLMREAISDAISGHQWPSVAISGHQWPSVAISGHQGDSAYRGAFSCSPPCSRSVAEHVGPIWRASGGGSATAGVVAAAAAVASAAAATAATADDDDG